METSESGPHRRIHPLPLGDVQITDEFWGPRIRVNREVTLKYQLRQCEQTGRIANYEIASGEIEGEFEGIFFNDSDVYKWMEAASYSITTHPDGALEERLDTVIAKVAAAQQPTGYLNTYFTLVEPEKKWTNLGIMHELYCAGHLFQAAVAHFRGTGKRNLLDIACRFADHIDGVFGPGKKSGMPGHQEIELALVDLYRVTGTQRYLDLAGFFLDQRGQQPSPFSMEIESPDIGGNVDANRSHFLVDGSYDGRYAQDHLPVRDQTEVVGHAVRAMYLYCAMTDVCGETGETALREALETLWRNVTLARMYVTGGIGPSSHNEGFTEDYHLPNTTAYAETCAAVGNIMWNWRMLMLDGDGRFADIMELALYNGFLSGLALDGKHFFYVNPLRSNGDKSREGWFGCACCPPNVARLLASLGSYAYGQSDDGLWVHLYISGRAKVLLPEETLVVVEQETRYPWDGDVRLTVRMPKTAAFSLYLRIPTWCEDARIHINEKPVDDDAVPGSYACLRRIWQDGDEVFLTMPMEPERLEAHPGVINTQDHVALRRGPLVYCLEETDNSENVLEVRLPMSAVVTQANEKDILDGICVLKATGTTLSRDGWSDRLYRPVARQHTQETELTAIPYYAWNNRGPGRMTVWIKTENDH